MRLYRSHFGAGNRERAKRASGQAVLVVLAVGISFTIVIAAINKQVPVWMQVDEGIRDMAARYFLILYAPMLFRTANIIFGYGIEISRRYKNADESWCCDEYY